MLLVTDIGADMDDTLALLALVGSRVLRLVAVVTCVNDGRRRGTVARGWLRALGVRDEAVPILPTVDCATAHCTIPEGFPAEADAALGRVEDTPGEINRLARAHGGACAAGAAGQRGGSLGWAQAGWWWPGSAP